MSTYECGFTKMTARTIVSTKPENILTPEQFESLDFSTRMSPEESIRQSYDYMRRTYGEDEP